MNNMIKKSFSTFTAVCFTLSILSFTNPVNINAEENEKPRYLSGIEINARFINRYCDWGKYDLNFYNKIMDGYNSNYNSEENALQISNKEKLAAFAKAVNSGKSFENKYIKLTEDIDLAGTKPEITEVDNGTNDDGSTRFKISITGELKNVWYPIGNLPSNSFRGSFNGNNHQIKNMVTLDDYSNIYAGFFGYVSGGEIKNLSIGGNSYTISYSSHIGGLVGQNDGSISNSYATGNIYVASPSPASVGGLVGSNGGGVSNSYATGNVYAYSSSDYTYAGGFVGNNSGDNIRTNYATGNVYATSSIFSYAGGMTGNSSGATISSNYATGNVYAYSSYAYAGGLSGHNNKGVINNNYATGNVSAYSFSLSDMAYAGGLVGVNRGDISGSYATGNVYSSTSDFNASIYAGGLVGDNSGSINSSYAIGNVLSASVLAYAYAGGLVGSNSGDINISYRNSEASVEAKKENDAGTINEQGTPLSIEEMTGTGANRAEGQMAGFKDLVSNDGAKIWTFISDSDLIENPKGTYTQTLYYPRLSIVAYKAGSEPKTNIVKFDINNYITANIIGELYENETLEVKITSKDSSVSIDNPSYKWYVGGRLVDDAIQSTYVLKNEDLEENIQVKITADGYFGEVEASIQRNKSQSDIQDEVTKIWILADYGVLPYGAKLVVKDMNEGERYETVLSILDENQKKIMERIKLYDISILNRDGTHAQPNGEVTIRLPIPNDFDKDNLKALRVTDEDDVEYENEKVVDIGGISYLEFETDHFSYYALIDKNMSNIGTGASNNSENIEDYSTENLENVGDMLKTSDNSSIILILFSLSLMASCLVIIKQRKNLLINF